MTHGPPSAFAPGPISVMYELPPAPTTLPFSPVATFL